MIRYEMLLLSIPEITHDESQRLESQLSGVIKANGGSVLSFERWGKYRLAYPVQKKEYGVYFLTRFETEAASKLVHDIISHIAVKLNDIVIRQMVVKLDPTQPLEYQRPQSLEEAPARDMGTFSRGGFGRNRDRSRPMKDGYGPRRSDRYEPSENSTVSETDEDFSELEDEQMMTDTDVE